MSLDTRSRKQSGCSFLTHQRQNPLHTRISEHIFMCYNLRTRKYLFHTSFSILILSSSVCLLLPVRSPSFLLVSRLLFQYVIIEAYYIVFSHLCKSILLRCCTPQRNVSKHVLKFFDLPLLLWRYV